MKNSHYTCEFFSNNILLMASSQMEFYRRDKHGKINIDWHGTGDGGHEVFDQAYESLQQIDTALIVARTEPATAATCLRLIYNIVREAKLLGVETRVILPDQSFLDAAEATGFSTFYRVFLSEAAALDDLGISDFYPLTLMPLGDSEPDPIAA
jgi:hypothetical protein